MDKKTLFNRKSIAMMGMALVIAAALATGCTSSTIVPAPSNGTGNSFVNTISVTGSGEAYGAPDMANIQLGIDVTEAEVGAAIEKANQVMTAVQEAVKGAGVEAQDMQTVNFNVYPEDVYDPNTGQPTGERRYHVNNFLNVRVNDVSKVGDIIDAGLSAGATNVSGLSFNVKETGALESEARTGALKDAEDRATQLAEALGVKLGKPVLISETLGGGVIYPQLEFAGRGMGGGAAVDTASVISTGQQTVTITVNVTYAISQ